MLNNLIILTSFFLWFSRNVNADVFAGLSRTQYMSLADNEVPSVPRKILSHLSLLRTLDLSRNRISRIEADDFKVFSVYVLDFITYLIQNLLKSLKSYFQLNSHFLSKWKNFSRKYICFRTYSKLRWKNTHLIIFKLFLRKLKNVRLKIYVFLNIFLYFQSVLQNLHNNKRFDLILRNLWLFIN